MGEASQGGGSELGAEICKLGDAITSGQIDPAQAADLLHQMADALSQNSAPPQG
jgi:hypothetical protein